MSEMIFIQLRVSVSLYRSQLLQLLNLNLLFVEVVVLTRTIYKSLKTLDNKLHQLLLHLRSINTILRCQFNK